MKSIQASRDPGHYVVDYGHSIEAIACEDESRLGEANCLAGLRRAENERNGTIADLPSEDDEALPSEVFFG